MTTNRTAAEKRHAVLVPNGVEIRQRKLADYVLDPRNPNSGTERGGHMIGSSVEQFGPMRSGVVDQTDTIRAGNHTAEELMDAGIEDVIEVETNGKQWVVVKRPDITPEQGKAYAVADNRATEVGLEWNNEVLAEMLNDGVDLSQFWHEDELAALLGNDGGSGASDPGPQIDRAGELQEKWKAAPGDLWQIGKHRLLCGDSTRAEDVARVMGQDHFRMIWTDPPYGVDYASLEDSRVRAGHKNVRASSDIQGDQLKPEQIYALVNGALTVSKLHAIEAAGLYVAAPAGPLYLRFAQAIVDAGFSYRQQLVWVKNAPGFGRTDYHYQHEPIIYGWLEGGGLHFFVDDHTKVTTINAQKPLHSPEHPTMKPIELITQMLENSSKSGEIVYEPFAGSGSTLVACEQTGRIGRGIDIEPKYCAVTLERLATMGLEAKRIG